MIHCDMTSSAVDWIIDYPESLRVLKHFNVDTNCQGKSLEFVCRQQGIDPEEVFQHLMAAINNASHRDAPKQA